MKYRTKNTIDFIFFSRGEAPSANHMQASTKNACEIIHQLVFKESERTSGLLKRLLRTVQYALYMLRRLIQTQYGTPDGNLLQKKNNDQ